MLLDVEGLFIKVSGLTSEADALFAVALGATAVGFDFGPTPRQMSTTAAHDIVRRLPSGVAAVGSFYNEMPERIVAITNTLGLAAAQVEGVITASALRYVAERVRCVIRAAQHPHDVYDYEVENGVDYIQLSCGAGLEHDQATRDVVRDPLLLHPLIVGDLDESTVVSVVRDFDVWGVDALGGIERSPGVKDPVRMGQFIANARRSYENSTVARRTWPSSENEVD